MRARLLFVFSFVCVLSAASAAFAGVPDPRFSNAPTCLLACPFGDVTYVVTVRDVNNAPLNGTTVTINFCQCSGLVFCPAIQAPPACVRSLLTGADGKATFALRMGGVCPNTTVEVSADGVLLSGGVKVRTLDFDGSLVVDGGDVDNAGGHAGQLAGPFDVDCSGLVDQADVGLVTAHKGHTCDQVIPARPASWGAVKTTYR